MPVVQAMMMTSSSGAAGLATPGGAALGMVQFNAPVWLLLLIPAGLLVVWWGRRSLSGMSGWGRRVSLAVRLVVVAALLMAVADPQWRR
ncbi:MAG: hypothetical protein JNK35_10280, partial [Phycisphaerae bacterium]|nr:hypothetical protein [Phycisphaerae bacterium]